MHTIEIRDATPRDIVTMTIYRRASLSNEGDRPLLLANPAFLELSDRAVLPGRSIVAVIDDRVIGFASVDPVDDGLELGPAPRMVLPVGPVDHARPDLRAGR